MLIAKIHRRLIGIALRVAQWNRIVWYRVLSTNHATGRAVLHQPLQTVGAGMIKFEPDVHIGVWPSPRFMDSCAYVEARGLDAAVSIGRGTWINNGFVCIAEHTSITIGRNCLLGADVEILDSDFHGLSLTERRTSKPEWARSVVLEDNVFVGSHTRILKGSRIGEGSVIANSSVVVGDIPRMVLAAGVPARVIRQLT